MNIDYSLKSSTDILTDVPWFLFSCIRVFYLIVETKIVIFMKLKRHHEQCLINNNVFDFMHNITGVNLDIQTSKPSYNFQMKLAVSILMTSWLPKLII